MKIIECQQKTPEWDELRLGKITGKKLKGLMGRTRQEWIYQLVAERLSVTDESFQLESDLMRGVRLEEEAIKAFEIETGKIVDKIGFCVSDKSEYIASSPDGLIKDKKGKYTEAVEVKCLSGKHHIEAFFTKKVPKEHEAQVYQYFIVNPDLKKLYMVFYDDRIKQIPLIIVEVTREEITLEIEAAETVQIEALAEVEALLETILFANE